MSRRNGKNLQIEPRIKAAGAKHAMGFSEGSPEIGHMEQGFLVDDAS